MARWGALAAQRREFARAIYGVREALLWYFQGMHARDRLGRIPAQAVMQMQFARRIKGISAEGHMRRTGVRAAARRARSAKSALRNEKGSAKHHATAAQAFRRRASASEGACGCFTEGL